MALSGWARLKIALAAGYGVLILAAAMTSRPPLTATHQPDYARHAIWWFLVWFVPVAAFYALCSAIAWVTRGFRQQQ
ncbi:MAG: hypothetical protein HMLKMBBP_01520 [Planctomycetes bacterium]|nr:hypothetical protein [Planctomycetota bacterium]